VEKRAPSNWKTGHEKFYKSNSTENRILVTCGTNTSNGINIQLSSKNERRDGWVSER
jgi:hypothetical protein